MVEPWKMEMFNNGDVTIKDIKHGDFSMANSEV